MCPGFGLLGKRCIGVWRGGAVIRGPVARRPLIWRADSVSAVLESIRVERSNPAGAWRFGPKGELLEMQARARVMMETPAPARCVLKGR